MARVLLVNSRRPGLSIGGIVPPLGLLYLAAVLRERARHEVRILDTSIEKTPFETLRALLTSWQPDILGISFLTTQLPFALKVVRTVRAWKPNIPLMIGGPHATAIPKKTLIQTEADAVVCGEAEEVIVPLVEALINGEVPRLPGVVTQSNLDAPDPVGLAPVPDLDALPLPARDLVDLNRYLGRHSMATPSPWRYATIMMSRGCPWQCVFCHAIHGKRLRKRTIEGIREEINAIQRYLGSGFVEILDDAPNLDLSWGKAVVEEFIRTNGRLRPAFTGGLRSDRFDDEFARLMARARAAFANLAFESGDADIQRQIKKYLDLDKARQTAEIVNRYNIYANGTFMLGFPDETLEQMLKTVRFALSLPLPQALFFRVLPLPGTALWEEYIRRGGGSLDVFDDYYFSPINMSAVPDRVFNNLYRFAYLSFYGRPTTIARILRLYPNRSKLPHRAFETVLAVASRWASALLLK